MDNLARNAMLARQAGMTYGKWKAMQPHTEFKKNETPEGFRKCEYCGSLFKPKTKRKRLYCEYACQLAAQRLRDRQKAEGGGCNVKTEDDRND